MESCKDHYYKVPWSSIESRDLDWCRLRLREALHIMRLKPTLSVTQETLLLPTTIRRNRPRDIQYPVAVGIHASSWEPSCQWEWMDPRRSSRESCCPRSYTTTQKICHTMTPCCRPSANHIAERLAVLEHCDRALRSPSTPEYFTLQLSITQSKFRMHSSSEPLWALEDYKCILSLKSVYLCQWLLIYLLYLSFGWNVHGR